MGDTGSSDLSTAWEVAESHLPAGWRLDALRCASTGLEPRQRSDDWIAVALGPDGQERTYRDPDPFRALTGLVDGLAAR